MDAPSTSKSHFRPRTREGAVAVGAFVLLFLLAQPPIVHGLVNRIEPWVLGMPFLYAWLLGVYVALTAVLIWALRKGV